MKETKKKTFRNMTLALLGLSVSLMVAGPGSVSAGNVPQETQRILMGVGVPFVPNQGQLDKQVMFFARTFSGSVYVTDQGRTVYQLPAEKDGNRGWVLVEETENSLPVRDIRGEKESQTKVSFFTGNDPSKWHSGLATYEMVNLGEIYEKITLKLRAWGGSVEKLYHVVPGGDPREIRIRIRGAESLAVNGRGEMEVRTGNGPVVFSRPRAFQQAGNHREEIEVAYHVDGHSYGFVVGRYDRGRELIIDPLIQSTYLGGGGADIAHSLAVSGGYVYVAGSTSSAVFPGTSGGAPFGGGSSDAFISRLNLGLTNLEKSTYLGGSGSDEARSLAVSGDYVYVAGSTGSADFPGKNGGYDAELGGTSDAFISKLNLGLTTLEKSTYLGGTDLEEVRSLVVSGDYVYVTGYTYSHDFPVMGDFAQTVFGGGSSDAFISKLNLGLTTLEKSTYLGGEGEDETWSLAVSGGYVYVAGHTYSAVFPGTSGGFDTELGGLSDAFISRLNLDLTLEKSTYLGGTQIDRSQALAVSGDSVYVTGYTLSEDFPGRIGGAQPLFGGGSYDAFISRLNLGLTQLYQSTYLGGTADDKAAALAVSGEYVYVAGETSSADFPQTVKGAQPAKGAGEDSFLSLLSNDLKKAAGGFYVIRNKKGGGATIYLE
ncbi:MAG: Beta-propeller repeat protein [Syntrophus sp. PtaB.Bin138]|nr:MAG: Beta-propeller repeat protein [Syntrophus sp. PtaB.Bin138]